MLDFNVGLTLRTKLGSELGSTLGFWDGGVDGLSLRYKDGIVLGPELGSRLG